MSRALEFTDAEDYESIEQDDSLYLENLRDAIESKDSVEVENVTKGTRFTVRHRLSPRQAQDVLADGLFARLAEEEKE